MNTTNTAVTGEFVDFAGERYYSIRNVDKMAPFFISVISNVDHWLFVSSTGGLTAGRVSPENALFPYVTVDRIHESTAHTGSKTILHVERGNTTERWEPFNTEHDGRFEVSRHIYKSLLGNKLCFEEINHSLQLTFRYSWATSDRFGFVRQSELSNQGDTPVTVNMLDGLQNILPANTPMHAQTNTSNLVDAYKWSELDEETGLAFLSLYSGISDRAEPCESLKATTVFSLGLDQPNILISSAQIDAFRSNQQVVQETHKRGVRGAYLVSNSFDLAPATSAQWRIVADTEQSQNDVVKLRQQLRTPDQLNDKISKSIAKGTEALEQILARGDAFQATAEETVSVHHFANVLFNTLRGGIFVNHYLVPSNDFANNVQHFNHLTYQNNESFLNALPAHQDVSELRDAVKKLGDPQLERLTYEYLPITFGRRHGDPSRPWNLFAIHVKDEEGNDRLSYQGNWRDIFQNWEALLLSYPGFVENVIAKFVNASTVEGYNPYRITKEGIDWEIEEPDNPWSYIGYWGDHQIIYLQKLLELSNNFHPHRLRTLLRHRIYSYANVPYRIKSYEAQLEDPKNTVEFDLELHERIEQRVEEMGADGKLILDTNGHVYLVNLIEKLLVPLLSKLGNLVVDGGIWLNTQRPEWNDANNALVGHGLSMVTLYYMRRYVQFLFTLLNGETQPFDLSSEVKQWLDETTSALAEVNNHLSDGTVDATQRFNTQFILGQAANRYRQSIYRQEGFSGVSECAPQAIISMLTDALSVIDHSIASNKRADGLYHAYNLINLSHESISVDHLYPMLEGQVAALSTGAMSADEAVEVLDALFDSDVYRADQKTFMLYPDRKLPSFLAKNVIELEHVENNQLLNEMLNANDTRLISRDVDGHVRFNADFANAGDLHRQLDLLLPDYGDAIETERANIAALYEQVFNHRAFTGRSGTMFGFEGLGSIYWHMVSKLLLAVLENFFDALDQNAAHAVTQRLAQHYYRIREGIGFNKTPTEYGAFPTDPYSHTPKHAGARQPGMTGQVKEEVLTRFGELGIRINNGSVFIQPALLRAQEFVKHSQSFRFSDVNDQWQSLTVPADSLAFTWCQLPIIYTLSESDPVITVDYDDGSTEQIVGLALTDQQSSEIFSRGGRIRQLTVTINRNMLFSA